MRSHGVVILDNIPVGCIYAHIEHIDESNAKSDAVLVVDFICVLKMYQQRGVGQRSDGSIMDRLFRAEEPRGESSEGTARKAHRGVC